MIRVLIKPGELDAKLSAWRNRPLHEKQYPFLIVDALVVDVRRDSAIRSLRTSNLVERMNEECAS
jgi:transposase-like protein